MRAASSAGKLAASPCPRLTDGKQRQREQQQTPEIHAAGDQHERQGQQAHHPGIHGNHDARLRRRHGKRLRNIRQQSDRHELGGIKDKRRQGKAHQRQNILQGNRRQETRSSQKQQNTASFIRFPGPHEPRKSSSILRPPLGIVKHSFSFPQPPKEAAHKNTAKGLCMDASKRMHSPFFTFTVRSPNGNCSCRRGGG